MRPLAFLLLLLTLATACILEDKLVDPAIDGGPDGSMCEPCGGETPVCNVNFECVACTETDQTYCEDRMLVCKTDAFECVSCNTSAECDDAAAAHCNADTNECEGCVSDADCNNVDGLPRCEDDTDTCVRCTPDTELADCGATSCDPRTSTCTQTEVGSVETCEECVADSECGEDGNRCVAMEYQGQAYPDALTGFCLKSIALEGSCTNPYRIVVTRKSLSGAAEDDYCGINEDLATCLAVRALIADDPCDPDNEEQDCPQPSGLCRELPGAVNRCTYLCASVVECVAPGSSCGSSGPGNDDYCGGG